MYIELVSRGGTDIGGTVCCTAIFLIIPFIFIAFVIGIANAFNKARTTYFSRLIQQPHMVALPAPYWPPPPPSQQALPQQPTVIIKEIVKIPCKYCGSLVRQEELHCPFCGAPLMR
ncbi:MAG: hypothetical protein AB1485_08700 [Candidatus Thermoplasmatota archaeon]